METAILDEVWEYQQDEDCEKAFWFNCPVTGARIQIAFLDGGNEDRADVYELWTYDAGDNEVLWGHFPGDATAEIEA